MSRRPASDAAGGGALSEPTAPVPAATVVLLRPSPGGLEVLLTRRPSTMAFGPDIHVFPGGRVDPADGEPAALAAAGISADEAGSNLGLDLEADVAMTPAMALAHHVAAVRETVEETGIRIAAGDLLSLSRWVTPVSLVRRFDVRFFAVTVAPDTDRDGESDEVADATWLLPSAALDAAASGSIAIWQPTFVTLQQLVGLADEAAVRAAFAPGDIRGGPRIEATGRGLSRVDAAWAAGIPGRRATGWLVGEVEVVVVNPADPTGVTTEAIRAVVAGRGARLGGVVITSLAPEKHAGVEMLAHGLGLPVVAPAGVVPWAPYPVIELEPGETLPFGDPGTTLGEIVALA